MSTVVTQRTAANRLDTSIIACLTWIAVLGVFAAVSGDAAVAVYGLSYCHYYLYWMAYRFGAVPLRVFKRDAVLMKTVALGLFAWVYFQFPIDWLSLAILALGFALNASAAAALGSDRTYYGYEVADLPRCRVTRFPYSQVAHPMLIGNIAAYAGALLNDEFRRLWWPLAAIHVALNLGLLLMEVAVTPLRLGNIRVDRLPHRERADARRRELLLTVSSCALPAFAVGVGVAARLDPWSGAMAGACAGVCLLCLYRRYAVPDGGVGTTAHIQPKEIG